MENSNPYRTHNVTIPLILIGIIAAAIVASVVLYSIRAQQYAQLNDNLEKQLEDSISAEAFHVSQVTALHISNVMQTTEVLASAPAIQDDQRDNTIRLLESVASSADVVQSLFLFDENAVLLYTTNSASKNLIGTTYANQTAFVGAKQSGNTFVSNLTRSLDGSHRIFVSSPIVDPITQEFRGVVGASILSETLSLSIRNAAQLGATNALSLIDPAGSIITTSGSSNSTVGRNIFSDEVLGQIPTSIRVSLTESLLDAVQGESGVYAINLNENPELNNTDTSVDTAMIAYAPVIVGDKIRMIAFVTQSSSIQNLITQSENPAFSSTFVFVYLVLAVMAAFAAAIIMINRRLIRKVIKATTELNESNSDLKKLTNELKEKTAKLEEADTAKEEFSAMITHELKTPLVPIIGYSELLLDGTLGTLTEKQRKKIQVLHENATSLLRLISDLLDVRKLELGQMKFNFIDASVEQIVGRSLSSVKPLAQEKNILMTYNGSDDERSDSGDNEMVLQCDPKRLQQVLHNLLTNAIKFALEDEGKIEVQTKKIEGRIDTGDDGGNDSNSQQQPSVLFAVRDNGAGIPKDRQQYLFRKFYQVDTSLSRNVGGTGLGLAISKGIVEAHSGKIWFESEPGMGTTFYFTIPLTNRLYDSPVSVAVKEVDKSK